MDRTTGQFMELLGNLPDWMQFVLILCILLVLSGASSWAGDFVPDSFPRLKKILNQIGGTRKPNGSN